MGINRDKPDLWKKDILQSVDLYNGWFMEFAPKAFRDTRGATAAKVESALKKYQLFKGYIGGNVEQSSGGFADIKNVHMSSYCKRSVGRTGRGDQEFSGKYGRCREPKSIS